MQEFDAQLASARLGPAHVNDAAFERVFGSGVEQLDGLPCADARGKRDQRTVGIDHQSASVLAEVLVGDLPVNGDRNAEQDAHATARPGFQSCECLFLLQDGRVHVETKVARRSSSDNGTTFLDKICAGLEP
jgi:hypothetical protein